MEVRDLRARDKYESRPRHRESLTKEASSPKAGEATIHPFPNPPDPSLFPVPLPSRLTRRKPQSCHCPREKAGVGRQTAREPTLQWRDWRLRFRGEGGEATLIIPQLVTARF